MAFLFFLSLQGSEIEEYHKRADELHLSQQRYWHLLLHFNENVSEIDDPSFFFAKDGKNDPNAELHATIDAFYNEKSFDDNSSACRFPARLHWLQEQLDLKNLPQVECKEYDRILNRLDPKSVTLVFPSAHINSPASMFGHTFLRINSSYDSRLLSYAINYAAAADGSTENGVVFAIKGLTGGYYGLYSLLPYYDKLKEYRDTESRDIWEYDLNFTPEETMNMVRHIWEVSKSSSHYYFFTKNCSYNMLWLMEVARPSLHLRNKFTYQVIPLETVHAAEEAGIVTTKNYRPSKRKILLAYEKALGTSHEGKVLELLDDKCTIEEIKNDPNLSLLQKQYIFEAAVQLLEYRYMKGQIKKEQYIEKFHNIDSARASLGEGTALKVEEPKNPDLGNRAVRVNASQGYKNGRPVEFLGIRPAYHDLKESSIGFMRGTQIEFLNTELNYDDKKLGIEQLTILSIESIAQRSAFFENLSWRMKTGIDRNYIDGDAHYIATVGAGYSWGDDLGYLYMLTDPLIYFNSHLQTGIGASMGAVYDNSDHFQTNIEMTHRWYFKEQNQWIIDIGENYKMTKKISLQFSYSYKDQKPIREQIYKATLNYFF